jgi:hypothetical protein
MFAIKFLIEFRSFLFNIKIIIYNYIEVVYKIKSPLKRGDNKVRRTDGFGLIT